MDELTAQLRDAAAGSLFPVEGELRAPGLQAPADVGRDAWGVPYIQAASLEDLWFAQGMVTAGERLFQIELTLRAATGRLSEWFGERTLSDDRFARVVGLHRAGARAVADWDEDDRAMHGRFREGIDAWIAAMPAPPFEYTTLGVEPALPSDEAAWASAFALLAWGLSGNWDTELLRAWTTERAGAEAASDLWPALPADPPQIAAGARHGSIFDALPRHRGQGSNGWVVSPERTSSGGALLANDPHLQTLQPGPWIELHLSAPGYRARGVALTFSPGILLGTTPHHAWGVTNVSGDVQDLYVERLDDTGTAAEYDGDWEPLTLEREVIEVRGDEPLVLQVRASRHGPLLESYVSGLIDPEYVDLRADEAYALRWTGHEFGVRPSLPLNAATSTDFSSFRRALMGLTCPGQNVVYADVEGTVGYACTGRYPVRRSGDGTAPVPGWTSEHEWVGWIADDELPWATQPARGFLATANNRPHDDTYPHLIGHDFHTPFRVRRIVEELTENDRCTVEDMVRLQTDTLSIPARQVLPQLTSVTPRNDDERWAIQALASWDADMRADSSAAAVYHVWIRHIATGTLTPLLGEQLLGHYLAWGETFRCQVLPAWLEAGRIAAATLQVALGDALDELREVLGPDPAAWRWGALHRARFAHPLAAIPGFGPLFVAADVEVGGDEQTVMQTGIDGRGGYPAAVVPSWRAVYDLADLDRSVGVLPTGVSGNPSSPHWNDQAPRWAAGQTHPLPMSESAVEAAVLNRLRLEPG